MSRRLPSIATRPVLLALVASVFTVLGAPAASAATVSSVSAGFDHTCVVTAAGGVRCWGANDSGQLGNGTTAASTLPVDVIGLSSGVAAVSAGAHDTCALLTSGGVRCWGGITGDGSGSSSSVPVTPVGLGSDVRAVSVGSSHDCALMVDGTVRCWGGNAQGQLGDGTRTAVRTPQTVPGLSGIVAVSAGSVHTCVLTDTGGVKCWGYDAYGQVGNGANAPTPDGDVLSPVDVVGLSSGVSVLAAGGYHTCALRSDGAAVCWGQNIAGELGDGTTANSNVPVSVSAPAGTFTSLEPGFYHTCGITSSGGVQCWGDDDLGSLGDGGSTDRAVPTPVVGVTSGTMSISGGRAHTCRVDGSGRTTCWGWNLYGQVGNGGTSPNAVRSPSPVVWFRAGFTTSCSGLACTLTDASTDPDGEITGRSWAFGDGGGQGGNATTSSHTYAAGGTYLVALQGRDAAGGVSTTAVNVTVTPWNLRASVNKVRNESSVALAWNVGATSVATVDVIRNGALLTRVANTGAFSHLAPKGTATYAVCPTGDARCSNQVTVKI